MPQPIKTGRPSPDVSASSGRPSRRSLVVRIFVGGSGLRAGWKVFLFFVIFGLGAFVLGYLVNRTLSRPMGHTLSPERAIAHELAGMLALVLATWVMARWVDKRPWGYFGMPLRGAFRSKFWVGALAGLATLALQLELMHLGGWFDFGKLQLHGAAILRYGGLWALMFVFVGVTEEGLLRGYVQRITTDGLNLLPGGAGFWASAVLFSLMFGAGHLPNAGENWFGIVMVVIDGLVMCFTLWRTGSLWFAIGNHAAWDWGQTYLFGTPDSGFHGQGALLSPSFHGPLMLTGGSDGPEGSILVLVSEMLVLVLVAAIYRSRQYPLSSDRH